MSIWQILLLAAALCATTALQRFCVAYGYEGRTRAHARREARNVLIMMGLFMGVVVGLHLLQS